MHLFFLLFALPFLAVHFLPTLIAGMRHTQNFVWILVINLLLSWTIVGWIIALIWALCDQPRYVIAYAAPPPPPYNVR